MMERYDTRGYKCGGPSNNDCMEKDPEGDYVLYSDAEAVEREKDEELAWMMNRNIDLERMWNASERYAKHCVTTIEETEAALAAAQGEVERMREVIEIMIQFIPDGWEMPLGWNQVVAQAQEAIGGKP